MQEKHLKQTFSFEALVTPRSFGSSTLVLGWDASSSSSVPYNVLAMYLFSETQEKLITNLFAYFSYKY